MTRHERVDPARTHKFKNKTAYFAGCRHRSEGVVRVSSQRSRLDLDELPTPAREIWGFPKRWGEPYLGIETDTLTGTLDYAGQRVAVGTMGYKYRDLAADAEFWSALWLSVRLMVASAVVATLLVLYGNYINSSGVGGLNVSSYMRYMHAMLLPLALIVVVPLLPIHVRDGRQQGARQGGYAGYFPGKGPLIALAALTACFYVADPPYLAPYVQARGLSDFRAQTMPVTQGLRSELPQDARIWVHFPRQDNRFLAWTLQYQLTPLASHVNNSHPDFLDRDPEAIVQAWAPYDYVWFAMLTPGDRAWLEDLLGEAGAEGRLFATSELIPALRERAQ